MSDVVLVHVVYIWVYLPPGAATAQPDGIQIGQYGVQGGGVVHERDTIATRYLIGQGPMAVL